MFLGIGPPFPWLRLSTGDELSWLKNKPGDRLGGLPEPVRLGLFSNYVFVGEVIV